MDKAKIRSYATAIRWIQVVLWVIVIYVFSSIPQTQVNNLFIFDFVIKKTAHLSEFAILFTLIYRASEKNITLALAAATFYAAVDEIHQGFVPGRTSALHDVFIDFSGANIAAFLTWKLNQNPKKKP